MQALEIEVRAALVIQEDEPADQIDTGEERELRSVFEQVSIMDYVGEPMGDAVDGASKEFREAVLGKAIT